MLAMEYIQKLDERIQQETQMVARGALESFEDYKQKCGIIKGLQLARSTFEELFKSKGGEERSL